MLVKCPVCLQESLGCSSLLERYEEDEGSCFLCGYTYESTVSHGRLSLEELNKRRLNAQVKLLSKEHYENDFERMLGEYR